MIKREMRYEQLGYHMATDGEVENKQKLHKFAIVFRGWKLERLEKI